MEMWTNDQLPKCNPTSCASIPSVTFLPASADGASLCNSQAGHQIDQSGQEAAHANHSAQQERDLETKTSDISGLSSLTSLRSADLTQSLASRLRQQLGRDGSMEYRQTWSQKTTPLGRQYWAHTASGHRISANVSTGWPTPTTMIDNVAHTPERWAIRAAELKARGINLEKPLATVAMMVGWPTPTVDDANNVTRESGAFQSLARSAQLAGWLTPSANEDAAGNHGTKMQEMLGSQVRLIEPAGWSTPSSRNYKDTTDPQTWNCTEERDRNDQLGRQVFGISTTSSHAETESRGALNANHAGWLMGFPLSWTLCGTLVQLRSKSKRQSTRSRSLKSS